MPKRTEISFLNGYVERSKSLYPRTYEPYQIERVTVGSVPGSVRYVLVESPMDHDEFKSLYRQLGRIGIMVPMVELINCAIHAKDILDTRAGRSWKSRMTDAQQASSASVIFSINKTMQANFKGLLKKACSDCQVIEYCDGLLLVEVRRIVDWNQLNRFEPSFQ